MRTIEDLYTIYKEYKKSKGKEYKSFEVFKYAALNNKAVVPLVASLGTVKL